MDLFNKKKIKKLKKQIKNLETIIRNNEAYTSSLEKKIAKKDNCQSYLMSENEKLIEWIKSILKEFGTLNVGERRVQIPIYKNEAERYDMDMGTSPVGTMGEEIIVIPEIVINSRRVI